jgi:hypothetical protein
MASSTNALETRRVLETQLIQKAWKEPEFRKQVVSDPKGLLEKHLGKKLPDQLRIYVHEEDANTLHFSVPPAPSNVAELSDEELEKVAGGTEMVSAIVSAVIATGLIASGMATAQNGW